MNFLIWSVAGFLFLISLTMGWKLKKFLWLLLPIILSLPISFGVWALVIRSPEMAKTGLGIIALAPVILIIIAVLNLIAALIGGIIGVIIRKITIKKRPNS